MTLRYINYDDPITNVTYKLPMVNVKLIHKDRDLKTAALIDSGSTSNFLPRELAEILDLDLSEEPRDAVGAGGTFSNVSSLIGTCQLIKNKESVFDEFTNFEVNVPIASNTLPYMVLGRNSIFGRFSIKFMERTEKIILKRF